MSFNAEEIELECGYEDQLQVVDLVDEMMADEKWQDVKQFVDGVIPENILYMSYEESPEKIAGLLDIMRDNVRENLCMIEREVTQIEFLDEISKRIKEYANKVVDDYVIGEILKERLKAA